MNPAVNLFAVIAALQGSPNVVRFVDRESGRLVAVDLELYRAAKTKRSGGEDLAETGSQDLELARTIVADKGRRFVIGPGPADFPEYRAMQDYIASLTDRTLAFDLAQAVKARGAFRKFKETLDQLGMRHDWLAFRDRALDRCAREWIAKRQFALDETPLPPKPRRTQMRWSSGRPF